MLKFYVGIILVFLMGAQQCVVAQSKNEKKVLDMVLVKGGTFAMGDRRKTGDVDELPVKNVLVNDFFISKYEITFVDYDKFCEKAWARSPEDNGWGRGYHPVINVSWYDAIEFCNWLSQEHSLTPVYKINRNQVDPNNANSRDPYKWTITVDWNANGYRLPTEAEWEYAARGGTAGADKIGSGSDEPDLIAWHFDNAVIATRNVGEKMPNELGIYDMSGNVWEWCYDWYSPDYNSIGTDNPRGVTKGMRKIVRGGSWEDYTHDLRVSNRESYPPYSINLRNVGFRVVKNAGSN